MAKDLKTVIFPAKVSFLIPHSLITLTMFLIESLKIESLNRVMKFLWFLWLGQHFSYHRVPRLHFSERLFLQSLVYLH